LKLTLGFCRHAIQANRPFNTALRHLAKIANKLLDPPRRRAIQIVTAIN
jgi:hypothetical protein